MITRLRSFLVTLVLVLLACGEKEEAPAAAAGKLDVGPNVGVLELPVSLRSEDAAPSDARAVELSPGGLRVDDQPLLAFEGGKVPAAERSGDEIPKLKAALGNPAKKALMVTASASLPYETLALVISTAKQAGIGQLAFKVRKPGGSTTPGWLLVQSFDTTPRTYEEVALASVDPRSWDEFATQWQTVSDACRTSQTGSCAYVPTTVPKGGKLKIVLYAAGQGVNVNFHRVGVPPEQLAAEAVAHKAELEKKKAEAEEAAGGGKSKKKKKKGKAEEEASAQTDIVAELTDEGLPSDASFQFRAKDAQAAPSAVTAVMQPVCGKRACGAVVSADEVTLAVRVVSLIGAAFADGAAAPVLAFELPWTPKPKPPAEPVVPSAEAPAPEK